jgi:hypothetical protein
MRFKTYCGVSILVLVLCTTIATRASAVAEQPTAIFHAFDQSFSDIHNLSANLETKAILISSFPRCKNPTLILGGGLVINPSTFP